MTCFLLHIFKLNLIYDDFFILKNYNFSTSRLNYVSSFQKRFYTISMLFVCHIVMFVQICAYLRLFSDIHVYLKYFTNFIKFFIRKKYIKVSNWEYNKALPKYYVLNVWSGVISTKNLVKSLYRCDCFFFPYHIDFLFIIGKTI